MENESTLREALAEAESTRERQGKRRKKMVRWTDLERELARHVLDALGEQDE